MRAIESSRVDLVQNLIERGAKVQVENKKGRETWILFIYLQCIGIYNMALYYDYLGCRYLISIPGGEGGRSQHLVS